MIREVVTDADVETWVRIRNAVDPWEATTVETTLLTAAAEPDRRLYLAELDGDLVACGGVTRSETRFTSATVFPRVLPDARRRGLGTALLQAGSDGARAIGCDQLTGHVDADDGAALAFAARFGFVEVDRQVELVRPLSAEEPRPVVPDGVEIVPLATEHVGGVHALALAAARDMPVAGVIRPETVATWVDEMLAGHTFVALAGGEVVGVAGISDRPARNGSAENNLTAVRADLRGRGIATALKLSVVAWAAEQGYRELTTWTQDGNDAMQAVNDRAGYHPGHVSIMVRAPLLP
jgi:GNAT superfamily N-acetyltransferase